MKYTTANTRKVAFHPCAMDTLAAMSGLSIPPMPPAEFIHPPTVPAKRPPMSVGNDHIEGTPRSWHANATTSKVMTASAESSRDMISAHSPAAV
jgi:hypothetical protein